MAKKDKDKGKATGKGKGKYTGAILWFSDMVDYSWQNEKY